MKLIYSILILGYCSLSFGQVTNTIGTLSTTGDLTIQGDVKFRDIKEAENTSFNRQVVRDKDGKLGYSAMAGAPTNTVGYGLVDVYYNETSGSFKAGKNTYDIDLKIPISIEVPANTSIYAVINYSIPATIQINNGVNVKGKTAIRITRKDESTNTTTEISNANRFEVFPDFYEVYSVWGSTPDYIKGIVLRGKALDKFTNVSNNPVTITYSTYGSNPDDSSHTIYFGHQIYGQNGMQSREIDNTTSNGNGTIVIRTYNTM